MPRYIAAPHAPLLFMPISTGPEEAVRNWLAAVDDSALDALQTGFNQKSLRQWKRDHLGHCTFTVVRHPALRLLDGFCSKILAKGPGSYNKIRHTLRRSHKLPIRGQEPNENWTLQRTARPLLPLLSS